MTVHSSSIALGARGEEAFGAGAGPHPPNADVMLELTAAVVAVRGDAPAVLVVDDAAGEGVADALPSGRFVPGQHTSLELGLRDHVGRRTGLDLGYVEQLYTFGNGPGEGGTVGSEPRKISIAYLALMLGAAEPPRGTPCAWRSVYDYFPWEDWRANRPEIIAREIEPRLKAWAGGCQHAER